MKPDLDPYWLWARKYRAHIANGFLRIISEHGRRFFHHEGRVSRFEVDSRGRIWFVDKWRGSRIYTHKPGGWGHRFSQGGTLLVLCKDLQRYIMGRGNLPAGLLGPWPQTLCGGDLWGYGDDMATVRERVQALNHAAALSRAPSMKPSRPSAGPCWVCGCAKADHTGAPWSLGHCQGKQATCKCPHYTSDPDIAETARRL